MITDIRYDGFIGIFDTEYNTEPLIEYWNYQNKVGSTFKRKGLFGRERKAHARKDTCLATEDFMLDHNCGYQWMREYNEVTGRCLEEYIDQFEHLLHYRYQQVYLNVQRTLPSEGFLYQSKRFQPKRGQFLIWPAGFTHVHRGNPPLSGEKYISTSWLENINA